MKNINLFLAFFLSFSAAFSQSVGIGTTTPDASAMLEVTSTSKGLLIPRLTNSSGISNPANGLIIYNTTSNELMYNSGTSASPQWETVVVNNYWDRTNPNSFHNTNLTDFVGIGLTNPNYQFHIFLFDATITSNPMMALENNFGTGYTSMIFLNTGSTNYTVGVDINETDVMGNKGTFKIVKGQNLVSSSQGDGQTMIKSAPTGIVDINNQSRCRVYQQNNTYINNDPNGEYGQGISYAYWTPVYYTSFSYDQHSEFALMPYPLAPANTPVAPYTGGTNPPPTYLHQFTATEDG